MLYVKINDKETILWNKTTVTHKLVWLTILVKRLRSYNEGNTTYH